MARFNTATPGRKTVNRGGGAAYEQTAETQLVHLLLTSFLKDKFYESGSSQLQRLRSTFASVDPLFAAKAAVYARRVFGMRSITHALAGEIAANVKGEQWTKDFFERIVRRPDDMLEILSYVHGQYGRTEPAALKKGFARALEGMDAYQLGKYRGEGKSISMVDVVNMVHPRSTEAIDALMQGTLEAPETWEVGLTRAGSDPTAKAEVWNRLLTENKLGYFALLRNLRNIAQQAPESLDLALEQLVDPERIHNSLVMPFRFVTAYKQFGGEIMQSSGYWGYRSSAARSPEGVTDKQQRQIRKALDRAASISMDNVPAFDGNTVVILDTSGSMTMGNQSTSPMEIGALFAAALAKKNDCDVITFGSQAHDVVYNSEDSLMTIVNAISEQSDGGATYIESAFDLIANKNEKYDRIIILSDMEINGVKRGNTALRDYKTDKGTAPQTYLFDLAGGGTTQFPGANEYHIAGFSDKVFDLMQVLEAGEDALARKIRDEVGF